MNWTLSIPSFLAFNYWMSCNSFHHGWELFKYINSNLVYKMLFLLNECNVGSQGNIEDQQSEIEKHSSNLCTTQNLCPSGWGHKMTSTFSTSIKPVQMIIMTNTTQLLHRWFTTSIILQCAVLTADMYVKNNRSFKKISKKHSFVKWSLLKYTKLMQTNVDKFFSISYISP